MRHRWVLATAAFCGLAATSGLPASVAAASATPSWQISAVIPGPAGLANLVAVTALGADAWAAGEGGPALYGPQIENWNGSTWENLTPAGLTTGQIEALGMSSPNNVWAAAYSNTDSYALRWNGHEWTEYQFHEMVSPTGLVVLSTRDVWVFGVAGEYQPFIRRFDGHRWHTVASPVAPLGASAVTARDIWIVGGVEPSYEYQTSYASALANWTGSRWREVRLPNLHLNKHQSFQPMGVVATGRTSVWVDGEVLRTTGVVDERSVLLRWNGKSWKIYDSPVNDLQQIASDGHTGLWLTADDSVHFRAYLVHFRNGAWQVTSAPLPSGQSDDNVQLYGIVNVPGTTSEWASGWIAQPYGSPQGVVDVLRS